MKHQTIFKTGNSLAVSLPSLIVKKLGLTPGQRVIPKISITKSQITYQFPDAKQLPLPTSSTKFQTSNQV